MFAHERWCFTEGPFERRLLRSFGDGLSRDRLEIAELATIIRLSEREQQTVPNLLYQWATDEVFGNARDWVVTNFEPLEPEYKSYSWMKAVRNTFGGSVP